MARPKKWFKILVADLPDFIDEVTQRVYKKAVDRHVAETTQAFKELRGSVEEAYKLRDDAFAQAERAIQVSERLIIQNKDLWEQIQRLRENNIPGTEDQIQTIH